MDRKLINHRLVLWLLSLICATNLLAQTPAVNNSADIYQRLQKLQVLGSVLYIAAHPDDENTRLLAYLANGKLYRTGYLSLTRGDGGQNLIGDEQGIELGLIRTQELLAARRIDKAEQFFSRAYDFGFSKNADETMKIWDKEEVLNDVVYIIRKFQPDVIITRFPGDERAGHGHHTASALLANEAFIAAADSTRYPQHFIYGLKPWRAKRILWNTFNFGGANTTNEAQFKLDAGGYNNLLGKGYGEIASESRSQHKSQGFGVARQRGQAPEYFETTGGDAPKTDLMEGIITNWNRLPQTGASSKSITDSIAMITQQFAVDKPEQSVPGLVSLYKALLLLPSSYWQSVKLQEVQQLIEACSGLFSEAPTSQEFGVPGDTVKVNFSLNNRNGVAATLRSVSLFSSAQLKKEAMQKWNTTLNGKSGNIFSDGTAIEPLTDSVVNEPLPANQNVVFPFAFKLANNASITQPFWLANGLKHGLFDVTDPIYTGRPEDFAAFTARYTVDIAGQPFVVERPVQYKSTDPVKGELYQPFTIIPQVVVAVSPNVVLPNVKPATNPVIRVNYASNFTADSIFTSLTFKSGMATDGFKQKPFTFTKGTTNRFTYPLRQIYYAGPQRNKMEANLNLTLDGKESPFFRNMKTIQYDHIPAIHYFYQDYVSVVDAEIKTIGKKIGYIPGAGDKVADALALMGYEVNILRETDLTEATLKQYDAIITGVRAYNVHAFLTARYPVLMDYIQQGGNLIVQYNTNSQVGPLKAQIAPYPFTISRTRVTDENAAVTFALPNHPALNFPNKITAKDFTGWIQERSTYHGEQADSHYETPLVMGDPGEPQSNGSLLITKYGKGNFVYAGLVFFRELPLGVGGAYRLMANLIALPKTK